MVGQDEIKGIDDHGVREDGSIHIIPSGIQVILAREGVSGSHLCSWSNLPYDIEILEKEGPASLATRKFVQVLEVGQVFMVSENRDGV